MKNGHIIEVTKANRRHLLRRQSDLSEHTKAERYEALMLNAQFEIDFWTKLWKAHPELQNSAMANFYEGQISAWKKVLFYAENHSERDGFKERTPEHAQ